MIAHLLQPVDDDRIVFDRCRVIKYSPEDLVVPGWCHSEVSVDAFFFPTIVRCPLGFEGEHPLMGGGEHAPIVPPATDATLTACSCPDQPSRDSVAAMCEDLSDDDPEVIAGMERLAELRKAEADLSTLFERRADV